MRIKRAGIGEKLGASRAMNDAAAVEDDRLVGDGEDHPRLLLDDDHRRALVADDALQGKQDVGDDDRREPLERLVEQKDARIEDQRPPDRQHLLLATGERVAGAPSPFAEAGEEPVDALRRPASRPRHRGQVLLDRKRAEDRPLLRHPADARRGPRLGLEPGDLAAIEADDAGLPRRQADQRGEQRRLAGAVPAEHRQRLAVIQREADVGDGGRPAIAGAQPVDRKHFSHCRPRRDRRRAPFRRGRSPPADLPPGSRRRPSPRCVRRRQRPGPYRAR